MCHGASRYHSRLCSNNGGRVAKAIEKAHDPWRDSIAWATVDWGVTISGCGAEELLGTPRGRHVMDVILYCAWGFGEYLGKQRREDLLDKVGEIQSLKNRCRDRERVRAGARSNERYLRPQVQGKKNL